MCSGVSESTSLHGTMAPREAEREKEKIPGQQCELRDVKDDASMWLPTGLCTLPSCNVRAEPVECSVAVASSACWTKTGAGTQVEHSVPEVRAFYVDITAQCLRAIASSLT